MESFNVIFLYLFFLYSFTYVALFLSSLKVKLFKFVNYSSYFINILLLCCISVTDFDVKVFTVASEENEGYLRYIRSAEYYDVEVNYLKNCQ